MKVSVILPTLGNKNLLLRAIKSIENQTRKADELIVIFDIKENSVTEEISNYLRSSKLNSKIIYTLGNKGGAYARNLGIKESENEIIMFIDEDDFWDSKKISCQLPSFNDEKCILSFTSRKIVNIKNLNKTLRVISVDFYGKAFPQIMYRNIVGITSTVAARKDKIIKAGLFDETMPCRQDYDLWIRMSKLGNFHGISKPLTSYTVFNDLSQVSSKYKNHIFAAERLISKYSKLIADNSLNKKLFLSEKWFAVAKSARRSGIIKSLPFILKSLILKPKLTYLVVFLPNFIYKRLGV